MSKTTFLFYLVLISLVYHSAYAQISATILDPGITITLPTTIGENYFNLDLNNDGSDDFRIGAKYSYTMENSQDYFDFNYVFIESLNENKINVGPYFDTDTISSFIKFHKTNWIYGYGEEYGGHIGSWPSSVESPDTFACIALQFIQNNNIFYGWVKLKTDGKAFTVIGYGWNQSPNQPIFAGQSI